MGCSVMGYRKPNYNMGMSEKEFVEANRPAERVFADEKGLVIYRTTNGLQSPFAFFAFAQGKLIRYEEVTLIDDYRFMRL